MDEDRRMYLVEKIGGEIAKMISAKSCEWLIQCKLCNRVIDNIHCGSREIASLMINAQRDAQCGGHNFNVLTVIRGKGDKLVGCLKGFEFIPFEPECD